VHESHDGGGGYVQERPSPAYWSPQRTDDWPLMRMKIVKTDDAMMM
jgi:uncharacterized protein YqjF (DUF2071 family)